jgi:hypothetical protein
MADDSLTDCSECVPPTEAFSVVANETRLSILEALWAAEDRPVSFTTLRKAVGVDDSAQFNYHLKELRGQFVRKVEDGYDLQYAGRAVIHAVLAGTLNEHPTIGPFEVEGTCIDCDATLQARYEDEQFRVDCADCGRVHAHFPFPPGGLEGRDEQEAMAAFNQRARHLTCLSADGVCPRCGGRVEVGFVEGEATCMDLSVVVKHDCQRCDATVRTSAGLALLDHADVVSFYRDHGVDLNARAFWTLPWVVGDRHTTVRSRDPWRVELAIHQDDEVLRVTLDESLQVVESERDTTTAADRKSVA